MNRIITINRATATLANLIAIKYGDKSISIKACATSHYNVLRVGFDLYLDIYTNAITTISLNNMIDEAKLFIQKTREQSYARK